MDTSIPTLELIALRSVRYSDTHAILTAYTRNLGRQSFLIPAGSTREATRRRALLMPLSIVQCKASRTRSTASDLLRMRDVSPLYPLLNLHSHPVKASVAMFIAEVLSIALRESQPDEPLFRYLVHAIECLDSLAAHRIANFHIVFLMQLARYLGIEPDFSEYRPGYYFSIAEGTFRRTPPMQSAYLNAADSAVAHTLSRLNFSTMHHFHATRTDRNTILDQILQYYTHHIAPMTTLTTLPILRSL